MRPSPTSAAHAPYAASIISSVNLADRDTERYAQIGISLGVDAFASGEMSEQTVHLARESGVAFMACGHHATERYGVAALAAHLSRHGGLQCEFVDLDNPV